MNDPDIIELYFARSQNAITETAAKYGAYLTAVADNILHCSEDSEETVLDTYFRAWNAIPPTRPDALRHFLSRITRNLSFDRLRHNAAKYRNPQTLELLEDFEDCIPDKGGSAEVALEAKEFGKLINDFLSTQSSTDIRVFVLRFYYAEPIRTIANKLNLTERQVKYRLSRLKLRLKTILIKEGYAL